MNELITPCQLWEGPKDKNGYGLCRVDGVTARVTRVLWKKAYGEIMGSLHVLHRCDNPSCVNLEHLFLGTHAENMQDMVDKGRSHKPEGELNGRAKLTKELVREMRALAAAGYTAGALATRFSVPRGTVCNVLAGRTWQFV